MRRACVKAVAKPVGKLKGGPVKLEGDRVSEVNLTFESAEALAGKVLQVGKKKFVRLVD